MYDFKRFLLEIANIIIIFRSISFTLKCSTKYVIIAILKELYAKQFYAENISFSFFDSHLMGHQKRKGIIRLEQRTNEKEISMTSQYY